MEDEQLKDKSRIAGPWVPTSDIRTLKLLGKCGEEVNELGTVVGRCVIQGIDGINPETGKTNRKWLEDEIADVLATTHMLANHYGLDEDRIAERREAKIKFLTPWVNLGYSDSGETNENQTD